MNLGKTLFAQLMDFLPWKTFHRIVARHDGDRYVKTMTCAEQFRVMACTVENNGKLADLRSVRVVRRHHRRRLATIHDEGRQFVGQRRTVAEGEARIVAVALGQGRGHVSGHRAPPAPVLPAACR